MKVFISWSGTRSRYVADALRSWLPKVLQTLRPWMSDEDIAAGARWLPEVSGELSTAQVGILCVTPENQSAPWLIFEAGALSKTLDQTFVCPMLFGLEPGQLSGPLAQFQASLFDREGVSRLLINLNSALGPSGLKAQDLQEVFDVWWPRLESKLKAAPEAADQKVLPRPSSEVLEEVLSLTREQLRRENLRLEHSQARDERFDHVIPMFEQMLGAAEEMQRRANEAASLAQQLPIPPEIAAALTGTGMPTRAVGEMMRMMKESALQSRLETQQLLGPSKPSAGEA